MARPTSPIGNMLQVVGWPRKLAVSATFALVAGVTLRVLLFIPHHSGFYPHKPGKCKTLPHLGNVMAIEASEPLELMLAFHKSDRIRASTAPFKPVQAANRKANKNNTRPPESPQFTELKMVAKKLDPKDFQPRTARLVVEGSVLQRKHRVFVYVLSKPESGADRVEVFELKPAKNTLVHLHSVRDSSFQQISDLIVLSSGRFVLSRDHFFSNPLLQFVESFVFRGYGSLVLFDGKTSTTLRSGLSGPVALAWQPSQMRLFVGQQYSRDVAMCTLLKDMTIAHCTSIHTMSSPHKLTFDGHNNELWIGASPNLPNQFANEPHRSTHVLRVRFQEKYDSWVLSEPFSSVTWTRLNGIIPSDGGLLLSSGTKNAFCMTVDMDLI